MGFAAILYTILTQATPTC